MTSVMEESVNHMVVNGMKLKIASYAYSLWNFWLYSMELTNVLSTGL